LYYIARVRKVMKIPPHMLGSGEDLKDVALRMLREDFMEGVENHIYPDLGLVIAVDNLEILTDAMIIPGDPRLYIEVEFDALSFKPIQNEVIKGEVVDAKQFGIFVSLGPVEGLVHKAQIMSEKVMFDPTRGAFYSPETKKIIEIGDIVRARIVQISTRGPKGLRIGLTMRQPYLGKEEWVEEQRKREVEAIEQENA